LLLTLLLTPTSRPSARVANDPRDQPRADAQPAIFLTLLAVAGSIALQVRDAIEERDAAIRRAAEAGASITDIALTTGLDESEVSSILG
jgi:hypothetical protein